MKKIIDLYKKYQEIINYLIAGVLTTIVSLATYYVCVLTFLDPNKALELQIANAISWLCTVLFAYIIYKAFVFKSKSKNIFKEFIYFIGSRISTLFVDMLIMFIMVTALGINDKVSKLFVQIFVMSLNYLFSKLFVFKKS